MPSVKNYPSSELNQYELSSRLLTLTENNTSYTLTQINGQRIYRKAPHAWNGPEPSRNCEVFIGRIPHDCFEDTLVPLFRQAGELFEFRLMINFSGWNRGYAFAMYTTEVEASNAIRMFNNYMIRPSWQLGVCPSINNCRIFISRIPAGTPSAEIVRLVYALTEEAVEVRVRRSGGGCAAIVEYRSHRGAAMARKALVAAAAAAWGAGARPAVDWSLPQSAHLLRQYREVGRWTPERGVEIYRLPEEPAGSTAASYSLERWSQARRLRMIHEAHRAHAQAHQPHAQLPRAQVTSHAQVAAQLQAAQAQLQAAQQMPQQQQLQSQAQSLSLLQQGQLQNAAANDWGRSSMSTSPLSSASSTWGTWGPWGSASEGEAPDAPPYNPWTAPHPLHEFMDKQE